MDDGAFETAQGAAPPSAVRVSADTSVDFAFDGVTGVATGDAGRSAADCSAWATSTWGLDTVLLSPLLNSLGIDLSGADILKYRTPRCDSPKLVG